jgi:hypothetical protein
VDWAGLLLLQRLVEAAGELVRLLRLLPINTRAASSEPLSRLPPHLAIHIAVLLL